MINFKGYLTIKYSKVDIHGYCKMKKGLFTVVVFFNVACGVFAQNSKRALLLLEKEDYLRVEQIFRKSVEKDSINPGAYYVYSRLFLSESFPRYNLDSSYLLILKAIDHYALVDQRAIERLHKIPIDDSTLWMQKNKIDSLAFQQALHNNSEAGYNLFLKKHPAAVQVNQAKTLRNKVAYKKARANNTYQSYKDFMDKYPEASESGEAMVKYNQLLFNEKTKEKSLTSYRQFLNEHPQTPFRDLIEKDIFEISTADNKKNSYEAFISQYPGSKYAKKALDYLYYHQQENGGTPEDFLKTYAGIRNIDSIGKLIPYHKQVLFPVYENNRYRFFNQTGKLVETLIWDKDIDPSYFCTGIYQDFVIASDNKIGYMLTKSGTKIHKGLFKTTGSMGYGLLKIANEKGYGVIHKAGWQVLPVAWDEVRLIANQFLAIKKNRLWGLATLSGKLLFDPQFQDIQVEGDFFIFEQDGKIAVTNHEALTTMLATNNSKLQFEYDDYQLVNDQEMIVMRDNQERLINNKLVTVIAPQGQKIHDQPHGWYVIRTDTFLVYNQQLQEVFAGPCDQYQFKDEWFGLKQNDKWALFNMHQGIKTGFEFDSIQFLSKNAIYLTGEEERSVFLSGGPGIEIKEGQRFQLILSNFQENQGDSLEYIVVTDPKKRLITLYNLKGEKIRALTNTQMNALYDNFFIVEKNGKKGIMNSSGKIVLATYYDAIGKPKNGIFSLLQRNKFGAFGVNDGFTIRPEYESALSVYNQSLLVATKSGKSGFIDHHNKKISPFDFEKIEYWRDSLAAVYQEGRWRIYNIYKDEYMMDNLADFQIFADSSEKKAIILGENGYGVIGNQSGIIIKPTFDDLQVIGHKDTYLFFCEKYVREAGLYVVIYYDKNGKMIRRQIYGEEDYDKIYCNK